MKNHAYIVDKALGWVVPSCWQVNYNAKEILNALSNMI